MTSLVIFACTPDEISEAQDVLQKDFSDELTGYQKVPERCDVSLPSVLGPDFRYMTTLTFSRSFSFHAAQKLGERMRDCLKTAGVGQSVSLCLAPQSGPEQPPILCL